MNTVESDITVRVEGEGRPAILAGARRQLEVQGVDPDKIDLIVAELAKRLDDPAFVARARERADRWVERGEEVAREAARIQLRRGPTEEDRRRFEAAEAKRERKAKRRLAEAGRS